MPTWLKLCFLRVKLLANKPNSSSDFSLCSERPQSRPIILRRARFSPKLWTLSDRHGSRNLNVSSYL